MAQAEVVAAVHHLAAQDHKVVLVLLIVPMDVQETPVVLDKVVPGHKVVPDHKAVLVLLTVQVLPAVRVTAMAEAHPAAPVHPVVDLRLCPAKK